MVCQKDFLLDVFDVAADVRHVDFHRGGGNFKESVFHDSLRKKEVLGSGMKKGKETTREQGTSLPSVYNSILPETARKVKKKVIPSATENRTLLF